MATPDYSKRHVVFTGLTPIMFNKCSGNIDLELPVEDKFYRQHNGSLCIPAGNLKSFYGAQRFHCVAKILKARNYKPLASALIGLTIFTPMPIPIRKTPNSEPIMFGQFVNDVDELSGMYVDRQPAWGGGVPSMAVRPVLPLPWCLVFDIGWMRNEVFAEEQLLQGTQRGGLEVGIGTYRQMYGKFSVDVWEEVDMA